MKTSLVLLFALLFCANQSWSQVGTGLENALGLTEGNIRFGNGIKPLTKDESVSIKGSSLILEDKMAGVISFKNNKRSKPFALNYDLLTESAIVYGDDQNYSIDLPYIDSLIFNSDLLNPNDKTIFVSKLVEGEIKLLKLLKNGKYTLYLQEIADLRKPTYNVALDTGDKSFKIKRTKRYILEIGDRLIVLPKKRKAVLKMDDFSEQFKARVKSMKVNFKKENEIIKLLSTLNNTK